MISLRAKVIIGFAGIVGISAVEWVFILLGRPAVSSLLMVPELLFGAWAVYYFSVKIVSPINELRAATDELRAGTRQELPSFKQPVEVEQLADSISAMVANERESRSSERAQLSRTQGTAKAVLCALPHAVALVSPAGVIEITNASASNFGLTQGMDVHGFERPWLPELVDKVRESRMPAHNGVLVQYFEQGRELFLQPQASPVLDASGELVGVAVVLLDVTEKRLVDEARSGLLPAMSHQIKTPMTSIQMSIHLLLEDTRNPLTPRQAELLQAARDDAARLFQLIEEWLSAARDK